MSDPITRSGSNYSAPRDSNRVPVTFGVSTVDGITPVPLEVNPSTGQLQTSSSGGGSGGTQYASGTTTPGTVTGNALIFDNSGTLEDVSVSNPLPVAATFSGTVNSSPTFALTPGSSPTPAYGLIDSSYRPQVSVATALPAGTNAIGSITNTAFTANAGTNLNTSALALESGGNLATLAGTVASSKVNVNISSGNITGFATSTIQTNGTQKSQIVDGSGNVIASTSNALNVSVANSSIAVTATNLSTNISEFGGSAVTIGTQTAANSMPVTLPSAVIASLQQPTLQSGSTTAVTQATASNLNATVVNGGTFAVQDSTTETNTGTTATNTTTIAGAITSSVMQSNIKQVGGSSFALGQQLAAASLPIVLTASQLTTLTPPAAITGFATSANQTNGSQETQLIGNSNIAYVDASNNLQVNLKTAIPAGTNLMGKVGIDQTTVGTTNAVSIAQIGATTASTAASGVLLVGNADGSGNKLTTNSTTYSSKFGLDNNLLGTLGTAFTTPGLVDIKGTDGNVFVRQATAANFNATVVGTGTFAVQAAQSGTWTSGTTSAVVNVGQQTSSTSAVQLSSTSTVPTNGIVVQAISSNIASVFIGGSGVTTSTGFELQPGQSVSFTANLNTLYIIGSNSSDKVCYNIQ